MESMRLVDHDPRWAALFEEWRAELYQCGGSEWVIEHIGSTAVPGLMAKPVIDLAVCIDDAGEFERHRADLEGVGWRIGSGVRSHKVMLREVDGVRVAIAHFFEKQDWATVNQRLFRDWLLEHPDDRQRYQKVKLRAAAAASTGYVAYNAGKTAFVQEIVDQARDSLGLPMVPAYDK